MLMASVDQTCYNVCTSVPDKTKALPFYFLPFGHKKMAITTYCFTRIIKKNTGITEPHKHMKSFTAVDRVFIREMSYEVRILLSFLL